MSSARLARQEIEREINSVPFWWHSIEIGGVTTPGNSEPERQRRIVSTLPDLRGKSVLDVAAWDGFFSFQAERLGAGRVVALDHLVWELDSELTSTAHFQAGLSKKVAKSVQCGEPLSS